MSFKKLLVIVIFVIASTACASNNGATETNPESGKSFYGTHLFVNRCHTAIPVDQASQAAGGEIAAALTLGIVQTGIDWIGNVLNEAAKDDIDETIVIRNISSISEMRTADVPICLQVVRGEFQYDDNGTKSYENISTSEGVWEAAKLYMTEGREELFIEILPIVFGRVVSFTPLEVRYSGYTPSDRKSKRPRDLALYIGYASSDNDISKGVYPGRLISFGTLSPHDKESAAIKYVSGDNKLSLIDQTQWLGLPPAASDQAITFAAKIFETREASKFVKFLAEAFSSRKDDLTKAATEHISKLDAFKNSKELEKEKLQAEHERIEKEKTYYDAILNVQKKEAKLKILCESGSGSDQDIFAASKEVYFAKKQVNLDAASAGLSRMYSDSDITPPFTRCPNP